MTTLTNYVFNMRHNKLAKDSASQATAPPTESNLIGPIMTYVNSLSLDPVSAISVSSADFEAGVTTAITGAGGSSESVSSYISRAISNYNTAAAAAATTARYTVRYFAIKSSYVAANAVGGGSLGLTICPLVYNLLSDGTAIPTSDAFSLAITNLVTNAGGNTTQANSAIADVRTAIYTTPFAPSPPPPAPTTYNVMGISGSGTEPAVSSVLRTAAVAATSGAQPLSQTLISLINSFTYGYTDLIQSNISNIELELYDATIYSGGITSLATAVKDAVTTAATSYYSPAVSPSFIFKVASSVLAGIDYTVPLTSINPIINATPSFSGLSNSVVDNEDGTTTITWTWTGFTDDGSTTDGLKIANNANFLLNIASLEITSFGGIQLSRASTLAFQNFKGSITSSTLPTIATNTNFTNLFKITDGSLHIPSINFGNIHLWDVSKVINMSGMFYNCELFTQNISGWNTSACTNMSLMFNIEFGRQSVFNVDISNWNTSACTNMSNMLSGNFIFNRNIGLWDVSKVTNMSNLFGNCRSFNQDISNWNTLACTNMSGMFMYCLAFNIQLETSLNHWTTENVSDMSMMFNNCSSFNKDLRFLNTANVTNMSNMFASATLFNQSVNSLDVSKVTNMNQMFSGASAFNQPIGWTSTPLLTNIGGMFNSGMNNAIMTFNSPITFSMSAITIMTSLFSNNRVFNQDISSWDTSNVQQMSNMFFNNSGFNQDISSWNTYNVQQMSNMFRGATAFNQDISSWNTHACISMPGMFAGATAYNKPLVSTLNHWTTTAVTNMSDMFNGATSFNQDLSSWTTTAVTNMHNMFKNCTHYKFANIGSFNFTQLTQFSDFINNTGFTTALYSQFLINLNGNTTLSSGLNLGTVGKSRYTYTNDAYTNLTTVKGLMITDDNAIVQIPCFLEGTKILCLDKNTNTDVYVPIQTLKSGDLVKTYKHEYVALKLIGRRDIVNSGDAERSKERLYQCTSAKYPELFEDLFITGSHSILVDSLTQEQRNQNIEIFDKVFITDDKYRLPACIDDRAVPYDKAGTFPIYHIALENDNYYMNYGVYANGLLVETCSLRYLQELSNMTLI